MKQDLEMIIFDLDGTLWETTDITYESANEIIKRYKINYEVTKEVIAQSMGCSSRETAKNYMPDFDEDIRIKLFEEMNILNSEKLLNRGGNLYPNLEEVLNKLKKNYKLAIVSNCGANYIEAFLENSKLEKYFDDFIATSKINVSKGDAIRKVMERNNIKNAIYVGDTLKDYEASQIANIEFIHAKYGFEKDLEFKYSINDIIELLEILERKK